MLDPTVIDGAESVIPERDPLYYLTPVTIQVEGTLFKVPRYGFMQNSPVFQDMFAIPQSLECSTTQLEGSNDKCPVTLPGVNKSDFRHLLEVIFPLEIPPAPTMPNEGWIAVLKLAKMWEMDKIRELSIAKLTNAGMSSIEKIVLAKDFHVPQWLRSGYQELIDRDDMLPTEDAVRIGYPSAISIFQIREAKLRRRYIGYGYGNGKELTVEEVFQEEFAAVEALHKTYTP